MISILNFNNKVLNDIGAGARYKFRNIFHSLSNFYIFLKNNIWKNQDPQNNYFLTSVFIEFSAYQNVAPM